MTPSPIRGYAATPYGRMHYAELGDGPGVLLLHQTPRSSDEFREVQPLLARGHRVIAMDMRGFGLSAPLPAPQTVEAIADGAWALLDALGLERAAGICVTASSGTRSRPASTRPRGTGPAPGT